MSGVTTTYDVAGARARFASLRDDAGPAFFDTPGGSQVPDAVREAIAGALRDAAANVGGTFATSRRVGADRRRRPGAPPRASSAARPTR